MQPAVVEYRRKTQRLKEGVELVFGRSASCDLPIGAGDDGLPLDPMVSSKAGLLKWHRGQLWVVNTSTYMPLHLFVGGKEHVIVPSDGLPTLGRIARVELRGKRYLDGRRQDPHLVRVRLPGDRPDETGQAHTGSTTGTEGILELDDRERLLLAAYCYPLLMSSAEARPCTHAEVGKRLAITAGWARSQMGDLRRKLSEEHGFPGFMSDGETSGDEGMFVLCRYAVRSGNLTANDLGLLEHWEHLRPLLRLVNRDEHSLSKAGDLPAYFQLTKRLAERDVDREQARALDVHQLLAILKGPPHA